MKAAVALRVAVPDCGEVSALLSTPPGAKGCYVMAHGAGAGMRHPFMEAVADGLHRRGIATLRYQFPFMEKGSRRPDGPVTAHGAVRAAVITAATLLPSTPLLAGGKSFGGRMTSQAQAEAPLPGVLGLAFFGFPLHPANKPSITRAEHLARIAVPLLFLQGKRDALADPALLLPLVRSLGAGVTLRMDEHADHAFHVPVRSGRTDTQVLEGALDDFVAWAGTVLP